MGHLAAVVQVRIEAHRATSGRTEMHERWLVRILERYEAVELEQATGVRRPFGPGDHDLAVGGVWHCHSRLMKGRREHNND